MNILRMRTSLLTALVVCTATGTDAQTPPPDTTLPLGGTSWQVTKFQGGDGTTLTPDDSAKYTFKFGPDGTVSVRIDCNRGRGAWMSSGPGQLEFGPLALTRTMCPPESLHDRIVQDLPFVRSYVLTDGHLALSLMSGGGTYELEAIPEATPEAPESPASSRGPVSYDCTQGAGPSDTLTATFFETQPATVLVERGGVTRLALQVAAASGTKYEGEDVMFWDAQGEAHVTWSGTDLECKPR
jgi:heat shock protein HslJ